MSLSIEIRCDHCRGDNLSIPLEGGEETIVDCEDCGAEVGTLADVKTLVSLKLLGRKKVVPLFPHWGRNGHVAAASVTDAGLRRKRYRRQRGG